MPTCIDNRNYCSLLSNSSSSSSSSHSCYNVSKYMFRCVNNYGINSGYLFGCNYGFSNKWLLYNNYNI